MKITTNTLYLVHRHLKAYRTGAKSSLLYALLYRQRLLREMALFHLYNAGLLQQALQLS